MKEIKKWEKENFDKITGWISDFSKKGFKIIAFSLNDKTTKVLEIDKTIKDPFEKFYDINK